MARASIYALPARYEPFGLSILEAALSGAALVLGDIPSLREVWGGRRASSSTPTTRPALAAGARQGLIEAPARAAAHGGGRAGAGARVHARAHGARATSTVYDALLGQAGIGRRSCA